ncbi:capsular biosynthesis protein [Gordonibacter sp. An230]|uniref:polysaccharide biosynthesis C-terminal domain-containing protein n=1 Tax=Gordonibacter sp. An230 TaxID=1965592 RepID=UPI000B3A8660|nr:NAD-dependent epimerase/dehydratase family protein [Gordonibacter sp. An230]OUO86390.1 capsular biosynthesis protein [Gordonibacter sp. An230]
MKVLVTGAKGFMGRNLCESLKAIRDGKDRRKRYQRLLPLEVYEYDRGNTADELDAWCAQSDFVFNLAGVNRPKDPIQFMEGNFGFANDLLAALERHENRCPVMLASSVQASLEGRFAESEYGKSKLAGESLFRSYSERTGAPVLIYRFPNVYGKWCRPRYNSVVATFCDAIANSKPYEVSDPAVELELLYIDDLVEEMLKALLGEPHRCGYDGLDMTEGDDFCACPATDKVSLGEIVELLQGFKRVRDTLDIPNMAAGSFRKKLYSTYLSYIDIEDLAYPLKPNKDERGSFTEILHMDDYGQVSVNISAPRVVKGNHWHHTKWEKFLVVSGEGLIRERRIGFDENGERFPVAEYRVNGADRLVVEMVPGMAHSIENLSDTRDLVTLIWANEPFDPERPDTYFEEV